MDPSWSSLQERCLHSIAEFLWQSCLDSAKDDLLDVHMCKRKVLKSIPFLADELRVRIFAHMLGRDQINPEIVKALTLTDADTDASSRGTLVRFRLILEINFKYLIVITALTIIISNTNIIE
jgi:hypothetical protein